MRMLPILICDYHAEIMLSSSYAMSQFVITRDTKVVYATLVPRSVRKMCAGEFFVPWDLSTPPGVLRSHGATRRRFFFPEQALSRDSWRFLCTICCGPWAVSSMFGVPMTGSSRRENIAQLKVLSSKSVNLRSPSSPSYVPSPAVGGLRYTDLQLTRYSPSTHS